MTGTGSSTPSGKCGPCLSRAYQVAGCGRPGSAAKATSAAGSAELPLYWQPLHSMMTVRSPACGCARPVLGKGRLCQG